MLLSDKDIRKSIAFEELSITPYNDACLQPASYDVHLGSKLLLPQMPQRRVWLERMMARLGMLRAPYYPTHYDPSSDTQPMYATTLPERQLGPSGAAFYLPPGSVALGHTEEVLTLDPDTKIAADIAGCSSLGRWFLGIHMTAGFIDPGWNGQLTLELYNASPWHIALWAGMRIAQLRFYELTMPVDRPYASSGHYAGSMGPVTSRYAA